MARRRAKLLHFGVNQNDQDVTTGREAELWRRVNARRGGMDAAEYKHVVLGLIFLKYISNAFEEIYARLEAKQARGCYALFYRDSFSSEKSMTYRSSLNEWSWAIQ